MNKKANHEWKGALKTLLIIAMLCAGIGIALAAWDDTKSTGDTLTASEWNAQVTDQQIRSSSATVVVAAVDTVNSSRANYICDGAGDQAEINAAIGSGHRRVKLLAGNYSLSNQIEPKDGTVLEGEGWENTRLVMAATCNAIDLNGYDDITIRDLEIDGNNRAYTPTEVIDGTGNDDVTIERIYMHDHQSAYGIELWNAKRLRILDSRFTRIGSTADSDPLSIQICEDVTIDGNFIYDSVYEYRAGAIEVQDGSGKIIITNNYINKSQQALTLSVHNEGDLNTEFVVANNIIETYNVDLETDTGYLYPCGITMRGYPGGTNATSYTITGNIVKANIDNHGAFVSAGIWVVDADGAVVSNNIIDNTAVNQEKGNYGIQIGSTTNATVSGNVIKNCYYAGIKVLDGASDIIITDNRCSGSEYGIDVTSGDYLILRQNNCRGNSIDGVNVTSGQNANGIVGDNLE